MTTKPGKGKQMESGRYAILVLMATVFLLQSVYLFIKKRRDKNFCSEPRILGFMSTGLGLAIILYDFFGIWDFDLDSASKTAIALLAIMILLLIFVASRSFSSGKKFTVTNIEKKDLEEILFGTLNKYQLAYSTDKKDSQSMVSKVQLEESDASIKINQSGGNGKNFVLVFEKFEQVYYYEDIIIDMKERVNQVAKAGRLRGIGELAAAAAIIAFALWTRTLRP